MTTDQSASNVIFRWAKMLGLYKEFAIFQHNSGKLHFQNYSGEAKKLFQPLFDEFHVITPYMNDLQCQEVDPMLCVWFNGNQSYVDDRQCLLF